MRTHEHTHIAQFTRETGSTLATESIDLVDTRLCALGITSL
jgi:hypothetical protein